uniref:DDE-1 domain-containing protein n=1 Tax=Hyaloperonospora arabidopsidis (strain Emoy2) TaxID=559515 RepID=M4B6E2_HYAAE
MHGKRVLLLLDNASCHYGTAECYNVKLEFLPPNMIAHLQQFGAGLTCGVSVGEYIGTDDDEPIKCDSDKIEHEAIENDNDGDSSDEVTFGPSEALDCCLRLSSFLSLQHDSDELTKNLASITEHVRKQ